MKTHKPQKISLLVRPFEFRRRFFLGVAAIGFHPLQEDAPLLSEVAMWKFLAEELGESCALDAAIPKSFGEFLVTGRAYPPGGAAAGIAVRARLGTREKTLFVFGNRHWKGRDISEPEPFESMPIDWQHTWGGEQNPENPHGYGIATQEQDGREYRPLPNVEHPEALLLSPDARGVPASFGPVDLSWPQRQQFAGTHDDRWLKEDFPGFARDIDQHFFNIAPADQQFDGLLAGNETYLLQHMHPQRATIEGSLPNLRMRCFLARKGNAPDALEEVTLRPSTAWFFPHAERLVLIHHGSIEITEEDATDITQILVAAERPGESKGIGHYRGAVRNRLDKELGAIYALKDSDLLPPDMPAADEALAAETAMFEGDGLIRQRAHQRIEAKRNEARAHALAQGLNPDKMGLGPLPPPEPMPTLEQLPEFLIRKQAEIARTKLEMEARKFAQERNSLAVFAALGIATESARKLMADARRGPPRFSAEQQINSMRAQLQSARTLGPVSPTLEHMLGNDQSLNQWRRLERRMRDGYRQMAHLGDAADRIDPGLAASWRESAQRAIAKGRYSFAGMNLTGADFSGMDFTGIDFSDALLESANFQGACLNGAKLENAVLAHACLIGASLIGANLHQCNLGKADLSGAKLENADLRQANLTEANLTGALLGCTLLGETNLTGARLETCDFSGAAAEQIVFNETSLRGALFCGANLKQAMFLKCNLQDADFSSAQLQESVFLGVDAERASFATAELASARFVEASKLTDANLQGALALGANLRGCKLSGANFSGARLDGADLSDSDAKAAIFDHASCIGTQFVKARMSEAQFTSANLREAAFIRAHLEGAKLQGANLYRGDLARVFTDPTTVFDGALALRTRTWPRWN